MKILYKYQNQHDLLICISLYIYKHIQTHNKLFYIIIYVYLLVSHIYVGFVSKGVSPCPLSRPGAQPKPTGIFYRLHVLLPSCKTGTGAVSVWGEMWSQAPVRASISTELRHTCHLFLFWVSKSFIITIPVFNKFSDHVLKQRKIDS